MIDLSTALLTPKAAGKSRRFAVPETSRFAIAMQGMQVAGIVGIKPAVSRAHGLADTPVVPSAPVTPGETAAPTLNVRMAPTPASSPAAGVDPPVAPQGPPAMVPDARQTVAADGSPLPDAPVVVPSEDAPADPPILNEADEPEALDTLYAWFATAMSQPPAPAPAPAAPPVLAKANALPVEAALASPLDAAPVIESTQLRPAIDTPVAALPALDEAMADSLDVRVADVVVPASTPAPLPRASISSRLPTAPALDPDVAPATEPRFALEAAPIVGIASRANMPFAPRIPARVDARAPTPAPVAMPLAAFKPAEGGAAIAATAVVAAPVPVPSRATPVRDSATPPTERIQPAAAPVAPLPAAPGVVESVAIATPAPAEPFAILHRPGARHPAPIEPAGGALAEPLRPVGVHATAPVQHDAIDLRRQEWMGQMVERVEALRDAAPAGETRIRLAPDQLGTVDVSIRHEGDRVHVHFAADTAAARQALSDAQPRLAELAEARGVRLGQTSVDSGAAGQGSPGQRHDATPAQPARPARADSAHADTPDTDDRIA